ncbi:hypothetical protein PG994_008971 [Apiospora phragmitis]|uniref:Uncharacterized protein n=1 Tax=Apiospora phragmitis TaxID=2905665 RepID=A0ABR1UHZ5_9PEZI
MRTSLLLLALSFLSTAADLPCDVESDNCRAVINGSACFNKYLAGGGGNTRLVLSCLTGTEGSATPQQKIAVMGLGGSAPR